MRKKILIVEDEEEFFFLYETMLEDRDYIIPHATDGGQAFELLKKKKPDIVILDLLPDQMSGD